MLYQFFKVLFHELFLGFQVTAVYVNNSLLSREENAKQLGDAQGVADVLSIPFQAIHLHTEEWNLFKR